jgi:uncharacterized membrane protein YfcA
VPPSPGCRKTLSFSPQKGLVRRNPKRSLSLEQIDPLHIVLLLAVGVLASIINVVAGGGSYLTLPLLIFTGLPPGVANGTNRVGILAGNFFSAAKFGRIGQLKGSDLLYFCLPATLGGVIGSWVATQLDDSFLRVILAVLMLFGSWTVIKRPPDGAEETDGINRNWSFPLFTGVGTYAGFIQAGTGFFSLAATSMLGHDLKRGNAIKTFMNLCLTVPALYIFWRQSLVHWSSGLALAVGMSVGGLLGVRVSEGSKPESLRKMIATAILISAVFIIYPLLNEGISP